MWRAWDLLPTNSDQERPSYLCGVESCELVKKEDLLVLCSGHLGRTSLMMGVKLTRAGDG